MARRPPAKPPAEPPPDPCELSPEELLRYGSLSVAGAVEFSGWSETVVKRLIRSGALPSYLDHGRKIPTRGVVLYQARAYLDHLKACGG